MSLSLFRDGSREVRDGLMSASNLGAIHGKMKLGKFYIRLQSSPRLMAIIKMSKKRPESTSNLN